MATKTDVRQLLFEALLKHYWKAVDNKDVPRSCKQYPKGFCISYGDLIFAADVVLHPIHVASHLHAIAAFCDEHYGVPLHALVVNKKRGHPGGAQDFRGKGFFAAPGSSADLIGWREVDIPKCIAASHLPRLAPLLERN